MTRPKAQASKPPKTSQRPKPNPKKSKAKSVPKTALTAVSNINKITHTGAMHSKVISTVPATEVTVLANVNDLMSVAQYQSLLLAKSRPQVYDSTGSNVLFSPTEYSAYCMLAVMQWFTKAGGLVYEGAIPSIQTTFNEDWPVPVSLALWARYYYRVYGAPSLARRFILTQDFQIGSTSIVAAGAGLSPYNFAVNPFTDSGMSAFAVYPARLAATIDEFALTTVNLTYSGLYTGVSPFVASPIVAQIANYLTSTTDINTVKFRDVVLAAPDYSGFAVPVGPGAGANTWSNSTAALCPGKFQVDLCPAITPNYTSNLYPAVPYPLGYQQAIKGATFSNFGFSTTGPSLPNNATVVSQAFGFFQAIGASLKCMPKGQLLGSKGVKYFGHTLYGFDKVVTQAVDSYGIVNNMMRAVAYYSQTSLSPGLSFSTNDSLVFYMVAESMLARRCLDFAPELLNLMNATTTLPVQTMFSPNKYLEVAPNSWWKLLIEAVGVTSIGDTIYVPVLCTNAFGNIKSGAAVSNYGLWIKTCAANIAQVPFLGSNNVGTPGFPFCAINPTIVTNFAQYNGLGQVCPSGAGSSTNTGNTNYAALPLGDATPLIWNQAYITQMQLLNVGGIEMNVVFPVAQAQNLQDFVAGYFGTQAGFGRSSTKTVAGKWGIRSMLTTVVALPLVQVNWLILGGNSGSYEWLACCYSNQNIYSPIPLNNPEVNLIALMPLVVIYRTPNTNYLSGSAYEFRFDDTQTGAIQNRFVQEVMSAGSAFGKRVEAARVRRKAARLQSTLQSYESLVTEAPKDVAESERSPELTGAMEYVVENGHDFVKSIPVPAQEISEAMLQVAQGHVSESNLQILTMVEDVIEQSGKVRSAEDKISWGKIGKIVAKGALEIGSILLV